MFDFGKVSPFEMEYAKYKKTKPYRGGVSIVQVFSDNCWLTLRFDLRKWTSKLIKPPFEAED